MKNKYKSYTIKELKSIQRDLSEQKIAISKEMDKRKLERILPKLKTKYEKKYFKSENSFGDGRKWIEYIFVHEVLDEQHIIVDSFSANLDNIITFQLKSKTWISNLIEIEIMEFENELEKCFKLTNRVGSI